jgi:hypothetical protein
MALLFNGTNLHSLICLKVFGRIRAILAKAMDHPVIQPRMAQEARMSTSANTRNPVAEGHAGVDVEATNHVTDAIQQEMNAMMVVPHMLMQPNLEAATHTAPTP